MPARASRPFLPPFFSTYYYVSCCQNTQLSLMLPIHLYYLNDAYIVSVWNCDICDILWSWGRSSITGVPHGGFGLLSPRSPARFKIWRIGCQLFDRLPRGVKISA